MTKEEIEAEGWAHYMGSIYVKGNLGLAFNPEKQLICIGLEDGKILYKGECEDIDILKILEKKFGNLSAY